MKGVLLLALISVAASATISETPQRIVGGSDTTINQYPMAAALLFSPNLSNYFQNCGGTILNNRSVLTATHCIFFYTPAQWRIRLGSSYANNGGEVYNVDQFIIHPFTNMLEADISLLRSKTFFVFSHVVGPGSIAGPKYVAPDNDEVWAIGWGSTYTEIPEQLQHVQIYVINEDICRARYGSSINGDQICAGVLDVGGRDQCNGDSGGPLFHNNVVVGITSYGIGCGDQYYPGVNTKVSSFSTWVQANA